MGLGSERDHNRQKYNGWHHIRPIRQLASEVDQAHTGARALSRARPCFICQDSYRATQQTKRISSHLVHVGVLRTRGTKTAYVSFDTAAAVVAAAAIEESANLFIIMSIIYLQTYWYPGIISYVCVCALVRCSLCLLFLPVLFVRFIFFLCRVGALFFSVAVFFERSPASTRASNEREETQWFSFLCGPDKVINVCACMCNSVTLFFFSSAFASRKFTKGNLKANIKPNAQFNITTPNNNETNKFELLIAFFSPPFSSFLLFWFFFSNLWLICHKQTHRSRVAAAHTLRKAITKIESISLVWHFSIRSPLFPNQWLVVFYPLFVEPKYRNHRRISFDFCSALVLLHFVLHRWFAFFRYINTYRWQFSHKIQGKYCRKIDKWLISHISHESHPSISSNFSNKFPRFLIFQIEQFRFVNLNCWSNGESTEKRTILMVITENWTAKVGRTEAVWLK